ncbi:hypothetical protein PR202_ga11963 [Eleusine coracana subsp. coracana]|uniref:Peptidase M20 dimerisation domain-containing protein n=1 Tax=Eleusine coracana subsp. coracana TaxID=191504 RepID=A0AAV5CAW4_ELECO|nr:hypothetical protein PR202_ga11963 [Eleusine coracana subsp. coracana]
MPSHASQGLLLLLACLVAAAIAAAGHDDAGGAADDGAVRGVPVLRRRRVALQRRLREPPAAGTGTGPLLPPSSSCSIVVVRRNGCWLVLHLLCYLAVNQKRVLQIDELASFSDSPAPSVTRVLYSDKDVQARSYIKGIMNQLGLSVREDAVGNIFGRWEGSEPGLGAVATGSHVDAIPFSGKYDGVVGVLGALEAISMLKRSGFQPKKSLEVIMFTSEEPTRFGISCLGSRLMAGIEELAQSLRKVVDNHNVSILEAAGSAGYKMLPEDLHSIPIGVVTAIAAPASIKVEFEGNGGHAGAVLMPARNDAGLAAAELALAVEKHVLDSGSVDTVGTVGILQLHPGAINSIPNVRDIDEKRRNDVIEKVRQSATEISKKRGVKLSEFKIINQDPPALSDKSVIDAMEFAAKQLSLEYKQMISRAYHDSLFMARISPMGMIFIPCYKEHGPSKNSKLPHKSERLKNVFSMAGYSHKPEEYASPEDMSNGVKVLALTMAKLSLE